MRVCIVGSGVAALAERLRSAGVKATVSARIQADIWYKLWGNMTVNRVYSEAHHG